jgi:hypothetical protein
MDRVELVSTEREAEEEEEDGRWIRVFANRTKPAMVAMATATALAHEEAIPLISLR